MNAQTESTIAHRHTPDIQRDMYDLQGLRNNSVSAIYTRSVLAQWNVVSVLLFLHILVFTKTLDSPVAFMNVVLVFVVCFMFYGRSFILYWFILFSLPNSHTLEHNSFGDGSLENTLAGTTRTAFHFFFLASAFLLLSQEFLTYCI